MYYPDKKQFLKLSRKGNIIPVYREIQADLDTPVSAFLKIRDKSYNYLLESVEGGEKVARYSFLGSKPSLVFKSKGRKIEIREKGRSGRFETNTTPLDEIKKIMERFKFVAVKGLPRFCGGLVGYIGYDAVRFFEELPDKNPDDLNLPDSVFVLNDTLLIFDHINHTIKIVANVHLNDKARAGIVYDEALRKIDAIYRKLRGKVSYNLQLDMPDKKNKVKVTSNFTRAEFKRIVNKAKEYIKQGDIIQVVPSQRFKAQIGRRDHFDIYRNLRSLNPSPYMYFLEFKDVTLVGASPEMLVRCEDGIVETRPIAGTRRRGQTEEEDKKLELELLADTKEKAEHLMLVDLGRNDLGRVCAYGKVEVAEFMRIERYSHVMHIVSDVRGRLAKGKDIYDVLKSAFPAGTVSGSPKIRAMEIIDELENVKRGPYAGCVGYLSFSGNLDTCITIRTIVIKNNVAYIQAGGGIVADSKPGREYQETVNKARAQIEALT
jgi:anthranilate synthase component 1